MDQMECSLFRLSELIEVVYKNRVATMAGIAGKAGKAGKSAFFIILAGKAGKSCLYTSCTGWKSWKKNL